MGPPVSRSGGDAMPLSTILIVFGSWIALLALTVWQYRRHRGREDGR